MLNYKILKKSNKSLARVGEFKTKHGKVVTPIFMPVGTLGSVKAVSAEELREMGAQIILGNTYHLYLRPGEKHVAKMGGLQKFSNWHGPILTDSGGFQVFSLGKNKYLKENGSKDKNLVDICEDKVIFRSHLNGSVHEFTPEKVIDIQLALGSDILMVLDICTEFPATYERAREAMEITHKWAKRAILYWKKKPLSVRRRHNLFGIVQGSVYKDLRIESAKYISSLGFDGIAVGGVSVGEGKENMHKVIRWVSEYLPKDKPHYLMGVGEPDDFLYATKYGFDMYDCVLPTRIARHGVGWIIDRSKILRDPGDFYKKVDFRKSKNLSNKKVLDKNCNCFACKNGYTQGYISHLIRNKEILGYRLLTLHNLSTLLEITNFLKEKIKAGEY